MSNLNYIMNYLGRFKKKTKFNYLFMEKLTRKQLIELFKLINETTINKRTATVLLMTKKRED